MGTFLDRSCAPRPRGRRALVMGFALAVTCWSGGCSIRRLAVNAIADSLASSGDVFASDDDPELIRDATPFALKTIEALLVESPGNRELLLAATRGFTQYAYAFVQVDAEAVAFDDLERSRRMEERALRLYLRARNYGLAGLALRHPGIREELMRLPAEAATGAGVDEVPLLYWTGAAWGAAISLDKTRPDLVADLPAVRALMDRALALDEGFERGAIHEAMIVLEALPAMMGGSPERARRHYERAVALSGGTRASPHVTFAESVCVAEQDRAEFVSLLEKALAVDPEAEPAARLANLIAQRRARFLLAHVDDYFLEETP